MSHPQLTQTNRIEIAVLFRTGLSYRAIARQIGFHHSTISRELKRHSWNNPSGYDARQARLQLKYIRLLANQNKRKLPVLIELVKVIEAKLSKQHWSPEQIAAWLRSTKRLVTVCAQTIYDWLYLYRPDLRKYLHCRKGKYRRTRANTLRRQQRAALLASRRIDQRPESVNSRRFYGHWEGDTIHGSKHRGYIATLVERKSGYLMAFLLPTVDCVAFAEGSAQALRQLAPAYRQTLTLDNGLEMQAYELLEELSGIKVYFAYPYHSWERGTNENTNGLLRYYFPKKTDLSTVTQQQLDQAVSLINTRPRKRLGYRTPAQVLKATGAFRIGS